MENGKEVEDDIEELLGSYSKESKGPRKLEVAGKGLASCLKQMLDCAGKHSSRMMGKIEGEYRTKAHEMETKVALDKQELERLKDADKTAKLKVIPAP